MSEYLNLCHIQYISPGDAAMTELGKETVDYHTSSAVLEHLPLDVLKDVLREGNRIIRKNGYFIHDIDYSDHFAPIDKSISAINFLKYSDEEYAKYQNKFQYVNRLRHDDFIEVFKEAGHSIVCAEPRLNLNIVNLLQEKKILIDKKFLKKSNEILSTTGAWIITQRRCRSYR